MERDNYFEKAWYRGLKIVGWVILGAIAIVGFSFLFGYFVMLLWNWLMPELFGLATITFWKAFGIILLARLIFGGFKHSRSDRHYDGRHNYRYFNRWRKDGCKSGKMKDWRYFDDYWSEEGEKSFNEFVDKKREQPQ